MCVRVCVPAYSNNRKCSVLIVLHVRPLLLFLMVGSLKIFWNKVNILPSLYPWCDYLKDVFNCRQNPGSHRCACPLKIFLESLCQYFPIILLLWSLNYYFFKYSFPVCIWVTLTWGLRYKVFPCVSFVEDVDLQVCCRQRFGAILSFVLAVSKKHHFWETLNNNDNATNNNGWWRLC